MTLRASVHFNLNDATPIADFEAWIAKCPAGICDHTILWGDAADKPWKDPDQESQIQALIDSKIALLQKFFGATDVVPSENDDGDTILALKAGDQVLRTGTLS